MDNLLAISYRFPPQTYPLAIRVDYFLTHLARTHRVRAITSAPGAALDGVEVIPVRERDASRFKHVMKRLRLGKISDLLIWPDLFVPWILPALYAGYRAVQQERPDALLSFAMPYSGSVVAALLKKLTGLPLILNLNDSPTCPDVESTFPTRAHAWASQTLEDWLVQTADAVVYVSKRNMERVQARQPEAHRSKFHLIRRGVRITDIPQRTATPERPADAPVRIVYTGGLSGWHMHTRSITSTASRPMQWAKRAWNAWNHWGRYVASPTDPRSHTPVYIGQAVQQLLETHPEWVGRVEVHVYGNTFPESVVQEVLSRYDLESIVHVHGPRPHEEALQLMHAADILFLTLPDRPNGTPGGRISAKTYEYLTTDRPILAAVPPGENHDYLSDKPGVFLSRPCDVEHLCSHLEPLIASTLHGDLPFFDRTLLTKTLDSTRRAEAFAELVGRLPSSASAAPAAAAA